MILLLKGAALPTGARGQPAGDVVALARRFSRLLQFAHAAGDRLVSIDLNPGIVPPDDEGAGAVDAVIEVVSQA